MTWSSTPWTLVAALNNASDRIKTLHVVADDRNQPRGGRRDDARRRLVDHLEDPVTTSTESTSSKNETLRPNSNPEHPDVTTNRRRRRPRPLPVVHGRVHLGPLQARSVEVTKQTYRFHREQLSRGCWQESSVLNGTLTTTCSAPTTRLSPSRQLLNSGRSTSRRSGLDGPRPGCHDQRGELLQRLQLHAYQNTTEDRQPTPTRCWQTRRTASTSP